MQRGDFGWGGLAEPYGGAQHLRHRDEHAEEGKHAGHHGGCEVPSVTLPE